MKGVSYLRSECLQLHKVVFHNQKLLLDNSHVASEFSTFKWFFEDLLDLQID